MSGSLQAFARCYAHAQQLDLSALSAKERADLVQASASALQLPPAEAAAAYSQHQLNRAPSDRGASPLATRIKAKVVPTRAEVLRYATIMAGLEEELAAPRALEFAERFRQLDATKVAIQDRVETLGRDDPKMRTLLRRDQDLLVETRAMSKTLRGSLGDKQAQYAIDGENAARALVASFIKENQPLSKGRMRAINRAVQPNGLKNSFVQPGTFRTAGLSKETDFLRRCVPHAFTADAVHQFLAWFRKAEASSMHPIELAARTYQRFVSIHPFPNGNGRTGRALMDWVLAKNGYPSAALEDPKIIGYQAGGAVEPQMAAKAIEQVTAALEKELSLRAGLLAD